ncbi:NUDIX domain-containing protein [Glycomyces tenuis]|uniref:NUDIX domain-containing protein n=1 Tax=Glycomyces tenuis TaxID=58116 RepID=UPI000426FD80|nr:NUDIX hydrolase [Glycomyces tenuis]
MHEYRVLETEQIHHGWCYDLVAETVAMPGGGSPASAGPIDGSPASAGPTDGSQASPNVARREFLVHCGAVVAVPLDESGRVGLIRQYRVPAKEVLWEFPAGLRDVEGEDPAVCAARELAEEVDLRADHWVRLGEFYTTPGISNERIHYFLASGLSRVPEAERHERTDEETHIELVWWDLDKALAAVADGEIRNGVCALALNLARLHLEASK